MGVACPPEIGPDKMLGFVLKERELLYGQEDIYAGAEHQQASGGWGSPLGI